MYAVDHSRSLLFLRERDDRRDLSRSVAPNHVRRYATPVAIISKRATSHRSRPGWDEAWPSSSRGYPKGRGNWRRSRPPEPDSLSGKTGQSMLDWWTWARCKSALLPRWRARLPSGSLTALLTGPGGGAGLWASDPPGGSSSGDSAGQVSHTGRACPHS